MAASIASAEEKKMSKDNQLVAVITGSSRGIGRGIAKVLGERGATVYVTGRTEVSGTQKSPNGDPVPGSIHEVAEEMNKLGGKGIAIAVDHTDDEQIRDLFERDPPDPDCRRPRRAEVFALPSLTSASPAPARHRA